MTGIKLPVMSTRPSADEPKLEQAQQAKPARQDQVKAPPPVQQAKPGRRPLFGR
jgi:hypothetical protein